MKIPDNLRYTKDHEWIRVEEDGTVVIGITYHAQSELGEIVYVEVETVGESVEAESEFGTVEAVKTTSELFMPITGEVLEFNDALENSPEQINESPYEAGWIIKILPAAMRDVDNLLSAAEYRAEIE
ncbi:MAG: glycine cleavage system protein GcvH [Bacteroidota bacterium]